MSSPLCISLKDLGHLIERVGEQRVAEQDWPIVLELLERYYHQQLNRWDKRLARLDEQDFDELAGADKSVLKPYQEEQHHGAKIKSRGHGKRSADDYETATHTFYEIGGFHNGQSCPFCHQGRMYLEREGRIIRVVGQASLEAQVHHVQKARCRLCGAKHEASYPQEQLSAHISGFNYKACAILIVYHYLAGLPFKRFELLQSWLSQKISDARLWDVINQIDDELLAVYRTHELQQIDEATTVRFDDTGAKINSLIADSEAKKVNASVFYFERPQGCGVLVYTGAHHAGEVFSTLLARRSSQNAPLIKTVDGANKNFCHLGKEKVVESVCNAHAYRKFKDLEANYPDEFLYVKGIYEQIYENDGYCRDHHFSPEARLAFHQEQSTELMERLRNWTIEKIRAGDFTLESDLSKAIGFISNQWHRLTEFLRTPGVPLDTNLAEQVVKIIIRYRNNSRSYQNEIGAQVGDRMMSLAYSVVLSGQSPISYFEWRLNHRENLKKNPESYTPQAFCASLAKADSDSSKAS